MRCDLNTSAIFFDIQSILIRSYIHYLIVVDCRHYLNFRTLWLYRNAQHFFTYLLTYLLTYLHVINNVLFVTTERSIIIIIIISLTSVFPCKVGFGRFFQKCVGEIGEKNVLWPDALPDANPVVLLNFEPMKVLKIF